MWAGGESRMKGSLGTGGPEGQRVVTGGRSGFPPEGGGRPGSGGEGAVLLSNGASWPSPAPCTAGSQWAEETESGSGTARHPSFHHRGNISGLLHSVVYFLRAGRTQRISGSLMPCPSTCGWLLTLRAHRLTRPRQACGDRDGRLQGPGPPLVPTLGPAFSSHCFRTGLQVT